MRGILPETRVLVIAPGISPDLIAERGANGALQFLEKPFELVEFGAAVQALLGPWKETWLSRGTLSDLAIDDVAVLALSTPRNVVIEGRADENRTGELHVRNSQITHARTTDAEGKRALVEMLTWSNPHFIENIASEAAPRTIHDPWAATLIEALHEVKKSKHARPAPAEPKVPAKPAAAATKRGPKILIIDDTEMLLIVVATIAKPFLSDALVALVQQTLKEGPLRAKPTFPSETEIARAKSADFAISKTPILPQPEQKPLPTGSKRAALPLPVRRTETGAAPATSAVNTGAQKLAPPRPTTLPPVPIPGTAPPQKLESVTPRLAPNEVLLDLPLDVVAMQVNAAFQIGAIRARPASLTVAIEIPALTARAALPLKTGFRLGPIDLDATGCISI